MSVSKLVRLVFIASASVLVLGAVLASAASAQVDDEDLGSDDQVVLTGRLSVPEGTTTGIAVIFNGPATIAGTVTETLVVFNGRTEISGTVEGDVVVFNGDVLVRSGAVIGGDLVTRQTPQIEDGATVRGDTLGIESRLRWQMRFLARFIWWVGYSISTLLLGFLLLWLAPSLDAAGIRAVRERMGAAIGMGAAAFFLLPLAAVLFLVVVVAIPLGIFLLLALALLYTVGYVVGAHAIGRALVKPPSGRFVAFLAGWVLVRLVGLIPIVGSIAWLLVTIFGLGVLWVAMRRAPETTAPVAAPLPPAPA
jgi:hypothetical protein